MNAFKIEYSWYEGEHGECWLAKEVEQEQFEADLKEAIVYASTQKYSVSCLPEYYEAIVRYLIKKKYIEISLNDDISYDIDDGGSSDRIVIALKDRRLRNKDLTHIRIKRS